LAEEGNRARLGFVGAGVAALAATFWAVFGFYADHSKPTPSVSQSIETHNGNVIASGPNATFNAPININPDAKEVVAPITDELKKLADQVAREKGVAAAPLRSVLFKLGQARVKDEDIPKRLDAAADELIKLRAEVQHFQHGPPALAAIAQEAQSLIDKGDLDGARHALMRGREAARAQRSDASRNEAKFLALDAQVDDLQLAYKSAAEKYAEAAGLVAPFDPKQQWEYGLAQAGELNKQGDEFGDNAALRSAIEPIGILPSCGPETLFPAIGLRRRTISAMRLGPSGSGSAERSVLRRRLRLIARRWRKGRASGFRSIGRRRRIISAPRFGRLGSGRAGRSVLRRRLRLIARRWRKDTRAGSAPMGDDADQSRHCA
jgi:tetratricopeptide (TPR) repeat protein